MKYNTSPKLNIQCLDNATIVINLLEQVGINNHFLKPQSNKDLFI